MIQTVTGIIDGAGVKNTLSHEHFVFGKPGFLEDEDNCYRKDAALQHGRDMLRLVIRHDVNLIVDATTAEWGRDPGLMRQLSEETGIHVVCASGFFKDEGDMLACLKSVSYLCDLGQYLKNIFVSEITAGIGASGIKAGVIKTASSFGKIKPLERAVFLAAAQAQLETGVPILTHCDRGTMGMEQAQLLLSRGVDPEKIIIGHMSSSQNLDEVEQIIQKGVFAAFDQFGILSIPGIPDDEKKMDNLLMLLKKGYEDFIVLSHDCCFDRMGYVSKSKPRYPDMIYNEVIPYLKGQGISASVIRKITRDNLLRAFG